MATTKKNESIPLMTTADGYRVSLIPDRKGYTFQVTEPGEDGGDELAVLTAAEWANAAIKLLVKCPDAKDPIGLVTAKADDLTVTGTTLVSKRKWTASFADVGTNQRGQTLLEWSSSRPLAQWEIGKAFKATIGRLDEIAQSESDGW
jgi:hypothetical protein